MLQLWIAAISGLILYALWKGLGDWALFFAACFLAGPWIGLIIEAIK